MSTTSPVILILGAGPNIGKSVARAFASKGYRVALASRTAKQYLDTDEEIHVQSDFADSNSIVTVFQEVKKSFGIPSVVVYNAAGHTPSPPEDPLSVPVEDFGRDLSVNTVSAFVAAQQAVRGFAELPGSSSKTFLYTGNILNTTIASPFLDLGVGKSATAHIIRAAASVYADRGFKFYYCDERNADGTPMYTGLSGDAHADLFVQLAETKEQRPWQQTFVNGIGYKQFPIA